jgi:hypothetical protein
MAMTRSEALRLKKEQQQKAAEKPLADESAQRFERGEDPPFDDSDPFSVPGAPVDGNEEGSKRESITKGVVRLSSRNEPNRQAKQIVESSVVAIDEVVQSATKARAPKDEKEEVLAKPPAKVNNADGMQRIIESVFTIDVDDTWKDLHRVLRSTEEPVKGMSPRKILADIDDACRRAHKLFVNLKLEYEIYEVDVERTKAAMRAEASGKLQAEKDGGSRSKAITEGDVTAQMVKDHPDEYKDVERKRLKFKLAVEHAETLVKCMFGKARSLQVEVMKGGTSDVDD